MALELTIDEEAGLIYLKRQDEHGRITQRIISPEALQSIIKESYVRDDKLNLSIPPSCIHASVSRDGKDFWGLFFIPAGKYRTRVAKGKEDIELDAPFPNLICMHMSSGTTFVYAVKSQDVLVDRYTSLARPLIKGEVELFHYPYSNVSGTGHVCWGDNHFESPKDLFDLEVRSAVLLSAVKTNHHTSNVGVPIWQYMSTMSELEVFPEDLLIPMGKSYRDLLAQY